ncbi:hypothetical protein HSB1_32140 [Halogranum salarium B-1]|uniref:DUF7344 domain-containing protein n=1 Tax=Halogranum salarium B-1 TaxID=1210908 RepID=J3JEX1_9EURY|nr:hypothetical protein HSB1_32140 [Halogranum salarium B-1]
MQDVLGDPRRRRVLRELADLPTEQVDFETLADRVAQTAPTDRERLASDLHHIHLPKLADLGVITYDAKHRTITHHTCRVADVLALASEALEHTR